MDTDKSESQLVLQIPILATIHKGLACLQCELQGSHSVFPENSGDELRTQWLIKSAYML